MSSKRVIIIGAGIAGLAAGCYAQMNGYQSHIYEMHNLPGGLCTAWTRKGYTFDGCIHYLFGTAPGQPYHTLWRELGALDDTPIANHRAFMHVVQEPVQGSHQGAEGWGQPGPPGKSVVQVMLRTDYRYLKRIYGRRLYDMEQLQESGEVVKLLSSLYPGLEGQIEVHNVATPMTYERFTGNWQGATCGWLLTKETMPLMLMGIEKQLPGLKNFYMAGHWVEPGGSVPLAAMSGRNAVQLICAADGQAFHADYTANSLYFASTAARP